MKNVTTNVFGEIKKKKSLMITFKNVSTLVFNFVTRC